MTGFNNKVQEGSQVDFIVMTPGGATPSQRVLGKVLKKHPAKADLVTVVNVLRIMDGTAKTVTQATRSYKPSRIMTGSLKKVMG